jgi:hypothetical protein
MASLIPASVRDYQNQSCALPDYPSSVDSGIVGHPGTNTYHQSIEDIPNKSGYTNYWPNDKAPPGSWPKNLVVATDQSKNRTDMLLGWKRWKVVFDNRKTDPRADVCAEYIGTPDGVTAWRMDFGDGSLEPNSDLTHTWHEHKSRWRKYANDNLATTKMLSIDKGETVEQYLASIGQSTEEDEMASQNKWIAHCKFKDEAGKQQEFWVLVDDSEELPTWVSIPNWETHEDAVHQMYKEYKITHYISFRTLCGKQNPSDPSLTSKGVNK